MIAEAAFETKPAPAAPDFSRFADRDFMEGVEMDEDQEWIREELELRMKRIESGDAKFYTLAEVREWMEEFKRERKNEARPVA